MTWVLQNIKNRLDKWKDLVEELYQTTEKSLISLNKTVMEQIVVNDDLNSHYRLEIQS